MKVNEWKDILEAEVEKRFDPSQVDGFEDSAPAIKLSILADMYDEEPANIRLEKEMAYHKLARLYDAQAAWH